MRINVMLMAFIFVGFAGFKFLYLSGQAIETEECTVGAIGLTNCFISFKTNSDLDKNGNAICPGNAVFNGSVPAVCFQFDDFTDTPECSVDGLDFLQDIADCIKFVGLIIKGVVLFVVSLILAIFAIIINIILLITIYLALGLAPIPQAPFIINFIIITPFVLGNAVMVIGFLPGGGGD